MKRPHYIAIWRDLLALSDYLNRQYENNYCFVQAIVLDGQRAILIFEDVREGEVKVCSGNAPIQVVWDGFLE